MCVPFKFYASYSSTYFMLMCCWSSSMYAEVVTDGSLGRAQALIGTDYSVTEDLGQRHGNNLFHSFTAFSLNAGESATFSGAPEVHNIISRVTGGVASDINGTISSQIQGAHLYLLNPSGIHFGAHAQLDISGSFYATTAQTLRFSDERSLSVSTSNASQFSSAAPSAFGFYTETSGDLSVKDASLSVPDGKTLMLAAGHIEIDSSTVSAGHGTLQLSSVSGAGELPLAHTPSINVAGGVFSIKDSLISTTSDKPASSQGSIHLFGGEFNLTQSIIDNSNTSSNTSINREASEPLQQDIHIQANNIFIQNGSHLHNDNYSSENAGSISLTARQNLSFSGTHADDSTGNQVSSHAHGKGQAGDILFNAPVIQLDDVTIISSHTTSSGHSGQIHLEGEYISIHNASQVTTATTGTGDSNKINIIATQRLQASNADIASDSGSQALLEQPKAQADTLIQYGKALGVSIQSPQIELSNNTFLGSRTYTQAQAGTVQLQGQHILIQSGSDMSTSTQASGHAGSIHISGEGSEEENTIIPAQTLHLSEVKVHSDTGHESLLSLTEEELAAKGQYGNAGFISIEAEHIQLEHSEISSQSAVNGHAGSIQLTADNIVLEGLSEINSNSAMTGDAGSVLLNVTDSILLSDSNIFTNSALKPAMEVDFDSTPEANAHILSSPVQSGKAGDIYLQAQNIELNGAVLASTSFTNGEEGAISLTASQDITLQGKNRFNQSSALFTQAFNGKAGNVEINAKTLNMLEGATIFGDVLGAGKGGNVIVQAENMSLQTGASINTSTQGSGAAGSIQIKAAQSFTLSAAKIFSDSGQNLLLALTEAELINKTHYGDAGNISIESTNITLNQGATLTSNSLTQAKAGNLHLSADNIDVTRGSEISSSSLTTGDAGAVTLEAKDNIILSNSEVYSNAALKPFMEVNLVNTPATREHILSSKIQSGNAGNIHLQAKNINLKNSILGSSSFTNGQGGEISLNASHTLTLEGSNNGSESSALFTQAFHGGAGNIEINAGILNMRDGARIEGNGFGSGKGGNVSIQADNVLLQTNTSINTSTKGSGNAGAIRIKTTQDFNLNNAKIFSDSGDDSILFLSEAELLNQPQYGNAGDISIEAGDIYLNQSFTASNNGFSSNSYVNGKAGSLFLKANTIYMEGGLELSSSSATTGDAGSITLEARDKITLHNSNIFSNAAVKPFFDVGLNATPENVATVLTSIIPASDAGNILLKAKEIDLIGARLSTTSFTQGHGGVLELNADQINIQGHNQIGASSALFSRAFGGDAGDIKITAKSLTMQDGARIYANSLGTGHGGNLSIQAQDMQLASGADISVGARHEGNGGQLSIQAAHLSLDSGQITGASIGRGDAGNLSIQVDEQINLSHDAAITTASNGANGGSLTLNVGQYLYAQNSQISTSVLNEDTQQSGNGGNIDLKAEFVVQKNTPIVARAVRGNGGNIFIKTTGLYPFAPHLSSPIDASSEYGISGAVKIDSPNVNVTDAALTLSTGFLKDGIVLGTSCAKTETPSSRFMFKPRPGVPNQQGDLIPTDLWFE